MSRGLLYPTHGHDFLNAAVIARSVADQDIESISPIEAPLDVLAQVIVSMVEPRAVGGGRALRLHQDELPLPPAFTQGL